MTETPDMSAKMLVEKVMERFNIIISTSAVTKFRRKLGWTQTTTHYCQMISDTNKQKRKDWCQEQLDNNETFDVSVKREYFH
jgi:transposase